MRLDIWKLNSKLSGGDIKKFSSLESSENNKVLKADIDLYMDVAREVGSWQKRSSSPKGPLCTVFCSDEQFSILKDEGYLKNGWDKYAVLVVGADADEYILVQPQPDYKFKINFDEYYGLLQNSQSEQLFSKGECPFKEIGDENLASMSSQLKLKKKPLRKDRG